MNLTPIEARVEFERLAAFRETLTELRTQAAKAAQTAYDLEIKDLFVAVFGRRAKYSYTKLRAARANEVEAMFQRHAATRDATLFAGGADEGSMQLLDGRLHQVGAVAELRAGAEFLLWRTVSESSYSSQGFGSFRYASNHADLDALHATALGVVTEVRRETHALPGGYPHAPTTLTDFHVWVKVASPTDLRLLALKPSLSLKETVRHLLRRGSNPRVMYPFLPYGYEASVGLDAFGDEITPVPMAGRRAA